MSPYWITAFLDSAPAPTIVVLMTILFVGAFLWQTVHRRDTAREAVGPASPR